MYKSHDQKRGRGGKKPNLHSYSGQNYAKPMNSGILSNSGAGQKKDPTPDMGSGATAAASEAMKSSRKVITRPSDNGKR